MPEQHGRTSRNDQVEDWADKTFAPLDPRWEKIKEKTQSLGIPEITLSSHEAKLTSLLMKWNGCEKIVEIGTLYGFSSITFSQNLGSNAHIWTLEANELHAQVAQDNINEFELSHRISLIRGDALQTLSEMEDKGPFDGLFIDAQKFDYAKYLDWGETNIKKGGLIIGDNTYLFGKVHKSPQSVDEIDQQGLIAMKEFNQRLSDPEKYESILIPTGEGLTVAKKLF